MAKAATKSTNKNDNVEIINRDELRRMAKNTGENVRNFIADKSEQASEMRQKGEDTVKAHPYKAVGAALVGGLVLGALLRRK